MATTARATSARLSLTSRAATRRSRVPRSSPRRSKGFYSTRCARSWMRPAADLLAWALQPRSEPRFDRVAKIVAAEIDVPNRAGKGRVLDHDVRLANDLAAQADARDRGQHHMIALAQVHAAERFHDFGQLGREGVSRVVEPDAGLYGVGHVAAADIAFEHEEEELDAVGRRQLLGRFGADAVLQITRDRIDAND